MDDFNEKSAGEKCVYYLQTLGAMHISTHAAHAC